MCAALQLAEFDLLVTSSSDQTLRFWKTNPASVDYLQTVQCWKLASPQICMAWADFVLYTANSKVRAVDHLLQISGSLAFHIENVCLHSAC